MLPVKTECGEKVVTAYILGDIDHHTAKAMREKIDACVESAMPELLILDFKDVSFMDSSGIGLVMGRYKLMQSIGGSLRITNTSRHINKVMRLAGLNKLAELDK